VAPTGGADLISLAIAVPLLLVATALARRGSTRGLLLWLGSLAYVAYQYGYTFAYRYNRLFLVYLALLSLSAFTLARALTALDPQSIAERFDQATPTRAVATVLWVIGLGLGVMELAQIIPTIITGELPKIVSDTGHPTSPVFILDLGMVVPLLLLGRPLAAPAPPVGLCRRRDLAGQRHRGGRSAACRQPVPGRGAAADRWATDRLVVGHRARLRHHAVALPAPPRRRPRACTADREPAMTLRRAAA
jgi:hypothetical protein